MSYHINDATISLDDLLIRLETTDLVPSRVALLDGLNDKLSKLKNLGINTLLNLRIALKTPKKMEDLVQSTGIDKEFFILLRREIESYFPKPYPLNAFAWLPPEDILKLEKAGMKDSAQFYEFSEGAKNHGEQMGEFRITADSYYQISCLCDLVRMQWTSPLAARMFLDAGYDSVAKIATADPDTLCNTLIVINEGDRYFKGNIGLRDIKRLITSASFLI